MMTKPALSLLILLALGSSLFLTPHQAHAETRATQVETEFFLSLEDIPLMQGLEELPDSTVSFDKPEGRIIESYALMHNATRAQVLAYYKQVLPQFGWGPAGGNKYFREREHLEISFENHGKTPLLKIMVRPSL
jgi:hypothetical protein